ncbi:hypothetical protein [Amycolatopsis jiangsuensis]|uniref:Uncharacterized protein n=1 Tax=Amycolatopsis jiangsuensis TaxID=1181879 RepID=A0A840J376_9PSEU|nr:hypothetical protein [Amycolatopsis jiangsuensis]MBB4689516.1 hypothetical protein [Amycolatopsis jiangsuensis]
MESLDRSETPDGSEKPDSSAPAPERGVRSLRRQPVQQLATSVVATIQHRRGQIARMFRKENST